MKKIPFIVLLLCAVSFAQTNVARMLSGVNAQTGTSYTFVASDVTKVVTFNNANPIAATLPSGTTTGFGAGSIFTIVDLGSGTVTISCSGCTINGAASLQIVQNQSASLYGDGTNYISVLGSASGVSVNFASPPPLGNIVPNTVAGTVVNIVGSGLFFSAQPTCLFGESDNTLDEFEDVGGTPMWLPQGALGPCSQFLTYTPLPVGVTPTDKQVVAYNIATNSWTVQSQTGGGTPGGSNGQIQYNNAGAFGGYTMSGDCTLVPSTGVITCPKTNGTGFGALATITPGTGVATFLTTPSSANLLAALTTKTGTGNAVFGTAPTISSAILSTAAQLSYITGSTQCLHVDTSGNITGTGSDCGAGGATAWSAIGTPAGNLALTMGANTSTFNTTTAVSQFFKWANTTAALVGASQSSPSPAWCGTEWHGGASVEGCMAFQFVPGTGTDAANTFAFTHTGSATGLTTTTFPGPVQAGSPGGAGGTISLPEGTTATASAGNDVCYGDSTAHAVKCAYNNGTFQIVPLISSTSTTTTQVLHATATAGVYSTGAIVVADLPSAIPIGNVGSAGLSGTAPVAISGTGAISVSSIPLTSLATQAADTAVVNATAGIAAPTAVAIGSCSAATSALTYNTSTHAFGCNSVGTVTSVATTGPITGGTITGAGTIACATCATTTNGGAITLDKSATGITNPTADATFTQPNTSTVGITLNGTAPASVATATGTNGSSILVVTAPTGGADSNATGTAGIGGSPAITAGAGGAGTGTNAVGGAGGSVTLTGGNGGASLGTGVNANGGNVVVLPGTAGSGGSGTAGKAGVFQVGSSAPFPVVGTAGGSMFGCGTAPTGIAANGTFYCNASNFVDLMTGTTDLGPAVAEASIIGANVVPKAIGTNPGLAASSITDGATTGLTSSTNFLKGANTVRLTANATAITATTPGTVVFTFGALPVSTNFSFHCAILYNQQTAAAAGTGFAVQGATNAPTRLDAWAQMYTSNAGVSAGGSLQNLTTTTATSIVTGTPSAITTVFQTVIDGSVQVGASATTLNILAFTGNASDSITIQAGSYCTVTP